MSSCSVLVRRKRAPWTSSRASRCLSHRQVFSLALMTHAYLCFHPQLDPTRCISIITSLTLDCVSDKRLRAEAACFMALSTCLPSAQENLCNWHFQTELLLKPPRDVTHSFACCAGALLGIGFMKTEADAGLAQKSAAQTADAPGTPRGLCRAAWSCIYTV